MLKVALDKDISRLQALRHSLMVINWMDSLQINNNSLMPLEQHIKDISSHFLHINYTHSIGSLMQRSILPKEQIQMPKHQFSLEELAKGHKVAYRTWYVSYL